MNLRHFLTRPAVLLLVFFLFAQGRVVTALTTQEAQSTSEIQSQIFDLLNTKKIRENAIAEYLKVSMSPKNPKPGATVRVNVESYLADLSKATVTWSVNGKTIEEGIGKTSFSFKVGASGETTHLGILIVTNQKEEIYKEYGFNPLGLTILWEADTYTPPFYKGKPLATYQARVRAIAVPDSANIAGAFDASTLAYVWQQNGYAVQESSGYGKNSYSFTAPRPYEEMKIGVSASLLDDGASSEFAFNLPIADPFILFYEKNPLLGVRYERPLGSEFSLTGKDLSISAEPFFFSNERSEIATFSYTWKLNGKKVNNPGRAITLRSGEGQKGESLLSLGMYGLKKTFQSASQSLRVKFNDEEKLAPVF